MANDQEWDLINRFSTGIVFATKAQIEALLDRSLPGTKNAALVATGIRLIGAGVERILAEDGSEEARGMLTALLGDFSRNLSRDGRSVTISVDWREGA